MAATISSVTWPNSGSGAWLRMDTNGVVVDGTDFGATQGSGSFQLSDNATLGVGTDVDVSAAIDAWGDTQATLHLGILSPTTLDALQSLGPGARFLHITNDSAETDSFAVDLHRPIVFELHDSPDIPAGGVTTTQQLSTPSGKVSGDFGGGDLTDDTSPHPDVAASAGQFWEFAENIKTLEDAHLGQYEFELLVDGTQPDTKTQTATIFVTQFRTAELDETLLAAEDDADIDVIAGASLDETFPSPTEDIVAAAIVGVVDENNISSATEDLSGTVSISASLDETVSQDTEDIGGGFGGLAYSFDGCISMPNILSHPITTTIGQGVQFVLDYPDGPDPPDDTCDLGVLSGDSSDGSFPTDTAALFFDPVVAIPDKWTLEWTVKFYSLPNSFSDLVNRHVFFGASDSAGPVAGIFISQSGIAYTGSIHHSGGNLVLDTPVQPLPNTSDLIKTGVYTTFRLAVDGDSGAVFLFVTETSQISTSGHQLVAVLPTIDASDASFSPIDQGVISVKGTTANPSVIGLDLWNLYTSLQVPNLPPVAIVGSDQSIRNCSIVRLDGSASFDPEGAPLSYKWRLTGGPADSSFVSELFDGFSYPEAPATGFTNLLHSSELGNVHAADPILADDVIRLGSEAHNVVTTGSDVNGFFVELETEIVDNLNNVSFKFLRQRGINGTTASMPTFFPDALGFYRFDLVVSDGSLTSAATVTVVNVVESVLPRGVTPDLGFMFNYLSDFWNMVDGRERLVVYWSALSQVAASELLTLWQYEYSKSHRDIQKTFIRRWIHYDLLLGEPLPELTTIRAVYSGVTSSAMDPAGVNGINGTSITLSSPAFAQDETISLVGPDPFTAQDLANELVNRLHEIDTRFSTNVITKKDNDQLVRITAPFPFTVESSTVPVIATGSTSGVIEGIGGLRASSRSYKTSISLRWLGIEEDDCLVLDGVSYHIIAIVDDPNDDLPYQRVVTHTDIPFDASTSWKICGYVRSRLLNFYDGLVSSGDSVFFEVVDSQGLVASSKQLNLLIKTTAFGAQEHDPSQLPFDPVPLGAYLVTDGVSVRLAKVVRRTYLPVDALVVDIPTLNEFIQIVDDTATLRRNVDYYIVEYRGHNALCFESGASGFDVWEGETPPDRLWAEYTYLDNAPLIEEHFGIPAEFTLDQLAQLPVNVDYLSAVRGLWYAYFNGPTIRNLRIGIQILLGLPFAEEAGTIEEIRTDFSPTLGRMLVRDTQRTEIVRSYTFPKDLNLEVNPSTNNRYVVGDTVSQFAPLVEGAEVIDDYGEDPNWFEGLLKQGIFYEVEKFFKFLVRVDSKAFNLETLLLVKGFILRLKPHYTYPIFLVQSRSEDTDISVQDSLDFNVSIALDDSGCDTALSLCPTDAVTATYCTTIAGGPVPLDASFALDTPVNQQLHTNDSGAFSVPSGTTGLSLTPDGANTSAYTSNITEVRVLIIGGPGADPDDYELVVSVDGSDVHVKPFTSDPFSTEVVVSTPIAINTSDAVVLRIRHGGGSTRNPDWSSVRGYINIQGTQWTLDDNLTAATYCRTRQLAGAA